MADDRRGLLARLLVSSLTLILLALAGTPAAWAQLETGVNRPGLDYRGDVLVTADPALCESICLSEDQCVAFTYVKPGIQGEKARCWLKDIVPKSKRDACCVSGVKPVDLRRGKTYRDDDGKRAYFPLGEISFADEVVSFQSGSPAAKRATDRMASKALGAPNHYKPGDDGHVSLGCGGTLTLGFIDNALVDIRGPDLFVFEAGPAVESADVSISADGRSWIPVGQIAQDKAAIDISDFAEPDLYHYVRLTDKVPKCGGDYPGVDIDSVGAIGTGITLSLETALLFDFGDAGLRPEAFPAVNILLVRLLDYLGARIFVDGHSDSAGDKDLSRRRAAAVGQYLVDSGPVTASQILSRGFGGERPIADNASEAGRLRNGRIEVTVIPKGIRSGQPMQVRSAPDNTPVVDASGIEEEKRAIAAELQRALEIEALINSTPNAPETSARRAQIKLIQEDVQKRGMALADNDRGEFQRIMREIMSQVPGATEAVQQAAAEARIKHTQTQLRVLEYHIQEHILSNGAAPDSLGDLASTTPGDLLDAWNRPIVYVRRGASNYELRSLGPDGQAQTADDVSLSRDHSTE